MNPVDEVKIDPLLVPVLVVEDEPETQFIYEKLLKARGTSRFPRATCGKRVM